MISSSFWTDLVANRLFIFPLLLIKFIIELIIIWASDGVEVNFFISDFRQLMIDEVFTIDCELVIVFLLIKWIYLVLQVLQNVKISYEFFNNFFLICQILIEYYITFNQ